MFEVLGVEDILESRLRRKMIFPCDFAQFISPGAFTSRIHFRTSPFSMTTLQSAFISNPAELHMESHRLPTYVRISG